MTTVDTSHIHKIITWMNIAAGEGICFEIGGQLVGADDLIFDWFKDLDDGWCDFSLWPESVLNEFRGAYVPKTI